jgi:hypothetical protein
MSIHSLSTPLALLLAAACLPAQAQDRPEWLAQLAPPRSQTASETNDQRCDRLLRDYDLSAQCYARFKTRGGIRAEAADRCGPPVKDPSVDCPRKR